MNVDSSFSETSLVGEPLEVTVKSRVASFRGLHKYQCDHDERFPDDWDILVTIPQEDSISNADMVEGWIFDIDLNKKEITVTTDSFGRADMHTLKNRHIEAADHVAYLVLSDISHSSKVDLDQVSHAKGLLSRCVRKDQWDWYTIYKLLGKPPERTLHQGRHALSKLRTAAQKNNHSGVQQYVNQLESTGVARRFAYFVRQVNLGNEYQYFTKLVS